MMTMVISGSDGVTFPDSTNQYSGGAFSFKNRIINGDMRIDQRNAGSGISGAGGGKYATDRWRMDLDTSPTITIQQSTTAPTGFNNSYYANITGAGSAPTSGQANVLVQKIEGFNTADLGFGTASAKTVTLSFWVRSSITGTFGGNLNNSAGNRSYVFQYTISAADTWEYKTVSISGDTTGTWIGSTNGTGIVVSFDFGSGSGAEGTANSWQAGYKTRASGNVNLSTQASATWYITGVQLEVGSVATPFERRPYGLELMLCQRYYYKIFPAVSGDVFCMAYMSDSTNYIAVGQFPVELRTAPSALEQSGTASHYASNNGLGTILNNVVPAFSGRTSQVAFQVNNGVASGLTAGQATSFIANNDAAYLAWSAEL
jgi:hypothetical protein